MLRGGYGNQIAGSGRVSVDFRYAQMFYQQQSGLYLTNYRAYDPKTARWLSRDPIEEEGGLNLYGYVNGNPANFIDPTGEFGIARAFWGVGVDLALQLLMNGGKLECVNWKEVGLSAAGSALGVGLFNGISKIKRGSNTWNATRKWLRSRNGPGGVFSPQPEVQYHHWLIEQNSAIGRMIPNVIKNQPWNLNPLPKATHELIHGNAPGGAQYGTLMRWWQGTPGWAKGVETGLGTDGLAPGDQEVSCECQ